MKEEKKAFVIWVKKHKAELIIAGISVVAIIAMIFGEKNYKTLEELRASLKKLVEKAPKEIPSVTVPQVPETVHIPDVVEISTAHTEKTVSEHIRNLHEGWKASTEKIATAAEHGYVLKLGQTWVEEYIKGRTAA